MEEVILNNNSNQHENKVASSNCDPQKKKNSGDLSSKKTKKEQKLEEQKQWEAFYYFIKDELLNSPVALSRKAVLRLKGISQNRYMAIAKQKADKQEQSSGYGYDIALQTVQSYANEIKFALATRKFNDEMHRINYICCIIEKHIGTIAYQEAIKKQQQNREMEKEILDKNEESVYNQNIPEKQTNVIGKIKHEELW